MIIKRILLEKVLSIIRDELMGGIKELDSIQSLLDLIDLPPNSCNFDVLLVNDFILQLLELLVEVAEFVAIHFRP